MAQLVLKNILAGSGNVLAGGDNTGNVTKVTIGANLTLSGGVLSATGGGSGSVTSVGLTTSATALTITNSPITTSGNIGINFAGTSSQYVRGDGTLATLPTVTGYVPYTGATQNVDLGTYGLLSDFIGFNTAPTSIPTTQGTLSWNVDKESLDLIMNGTTGSLMQDTFYNVKNQTGAAIPKGTVVRADGTVGASGRIKIAPFKADGTYNSKYCMGVTAETIADGADGKVLAFGALRKIDTSAYTNGTILYASPATAGAFTITEPSNPNNIVTLAIVVYSDSTNGEIFVRPTFVPSQDELIKSLGYTPANDANVVKLTGNQTVGGVKTFSSESIFGGGITLTGGDLVLKSGTYTNTINTDTLTESRSILFPDNSGTVALLTDIDYPVTSVFGRTGDVVAASGDYDTDMVDEGTTNLYYTNARARAALSVNTGSALGYNNTTGRFTLVAAESGVDGYLTGTDWDAFDAKQNSLGTGTTSQFLRGDLVWAAPPTPALEDLTDVGITSPTNGQLLRYQVGTWVNWTPNYVSATYFSATAPLSYNSGTGVFSISQATTSTNGYLSSTDWNTFNNKQNALTNPVTGTGATGYIAKWNTASTITNSLIYEASSKVGINTTNMVSLFDVTKNALGVTVVDTSGITLKNETEAITGNQQISPALHFKSNGWNNLASASQSADWIEYSLPIQGNAVTSNLIWASSINGAAYTTRFTLNSAGNGTFTGTLAASNLSGTNTGDVTIGTANGLSLSGQAISLALASTSTTGALSSTDWNTFNNKASTSDLSNYLPLTGGTLIGALGGTTASFSSTVTATSYNRSAAGTGFLNGKYNGVENTNTTGPIYCIGDTYIPTATSSGAMYGIGYSYNSFTGAFGPTNTWGMYVAAGGGVGVFLSGGGDGYFAGNIKTTGNIGINQNAKGYYYSGANRYGINIGGYADIFSLSNYSLYIGANIYYDNGWYRQNSTGASMIEFQASDGSINFYGNPSATAGSISPNVLMRLPNSGNLLINTTTDAGYKLDVNGTGRFSGTLTAGATNSQIKLTGGSTDAFIGISTSTLYLTDWATAAKGLTINLTSGAATFSSSVTAGGNIISQASSGFIGAFSTNPANDVVVGSYWSSSASGLEMRYNPNSAVGYIQSLYQVVSGQAFGDIHFRQNVSGTMTTRLLIKADGGNATFSNSVAIGGAGMGLTGINMPNQNYLAWYLSGGSGAQNVAIRGNGNNLELSSGGGLTMTMDASQRVGIKTSTPSYSLSVSGSINAGYVVIGDVNNNNNSTIEFVNGLNSTTYFTGDGNINYYGGGNLTLCKGGGKVLIGTTTDAGYKLDVNGTSIIRGYLTVSESYTRSAAGKGYLNGGYSGAESTTSPGPIYCISQNYAPTATSSNNMYGVGYSYNNFTGYYGPATTWGFYVAAGGGIGVFLSGGGAGYFASSVTATAFFESSDKRLKEELDSNALIDDISKIKAKLYLKEGKKEIGYYAQDLEEIMPYAVSEGGDKYLTLSYSQVHTAKIAKLEAELAELKEIVKNLIK